MGYVALLAACWLAELLRAPVPGAAGEATLRTNIAGPALAEFHQWELSLPPGPPIRIIDIDAVMPAHNHGLAQRPRLARLADRSFRLDGVRFHMTGAWEWRLRYEDALGAHAAVLPFEVQYAGSQLRSLALASRGTPRPDATNRFADHPGAAALGKQLFFDARLSGGGQTSCATCHRPETAFADNLRVSKRGVKRNTPGLLGVSESPWLFWDGRRDSLWSQALLPIESPEEMGGSRAGVAALLRGPYRDAYTQVTSLDPSRMPVDRLFADAGKFLAAYERTLQPQPSRFDRYVDDLDHGRPSNALNADEIAGLNLFLSAETQCTQCHNGPLFTNQGFHNIGTGTTTGDQPDFGRAMGLASLPLDAFNCRSIFSDRRDACPSLDFARPASHGDRLMGAFKVPSLRNAALTAPYLHDGSLATLEDVIRHYTRPRQPSELRPFALTPEQVSQLAAFLRTLTSSGASSPAKLH